MTWHPLHVTATSEDWKWWPLVDGVRILMELFRSEKAWLHIYHPRKKLKNAKGVTIFFSYTLKNTFLEKVLATLGWDHIKPPINLAFLKKISQGPGQVMRTLISWNWHINGSNSCCVWMRVWCFFGVDDCWVSRDLKTWSSICDAPASETAKRNSTPKEIYLSNGINKQTGIFI